MQSAVENMLHHRSPVMDGGITGERILELSHMATSGYLVNDAVTPNVGFLIRKTASFRNKQIQIERTNCPSVLWSRLCTPSQCITDVFH